MPQPATERHAWVGDTSQWVTPGLLVCFLADDSPRHTASGCSIPCADYSVTICPGAACSCRMPARLLKGFQLQLWSATGLAAGCAKMQGTFPSSNLQAAYLTYSCMLCFVCVRRYRWQHTQTCFPGVTEDVPHAATPFQLQWLGFKVTGPLGGFHPWWAGGYWLVRALRLGLNCPR